jgi:hypothetical protein
MSGMQPDEDESLGHAYRAAGEEVGQRRPRQIPPEQRTGPDRVAGQASHRNSRDAPAPLDQRENPKSQRDELDLDKIRAQARREVELEKAKRYEWQKIGFEQREREAMAAARLQSQREQYQKTHDPNEHAKIIKEKQRLDEWYARDKAFKDRWANRAQQKPGREQTDRSREQGDAAQSREASRWGREFSEAARQAASHAREATDRDDGRGR